MSESYTEHIKTFENTLDKFEKALERQAKDISDIKQALLGTEFGETGIVNRVMRAEREIESLKDFKNRIKWMAVGISVGSSGITFAALKIIFGL